jgi:Phasin protein
MNKRKPPPSKHARSSKIATKAQRAAQAIVKSPKDSRVHSIVADPTEPPPKGRNETVQKSLLVENPAAAVQPNETEQELLLVENPATALEPNDTKQEALRVESPALAVEDSKQNMMNKDSKKGFDFSSAAANVQAYQAKLLEVAQANLQFAFEFAQRLAAIRSPFEVLGVTAEFTSKRIAMFQKHSKEIAGLSTERMNGLRARPAPAVNRPS